MLQIARTHISVVALSDLVLRLVLGLKVVVDLQRQSSCVLSAVFDVDNFLRLASLVLVQWRAGSHCLDVRRVHAS